MRNTLLVADLHLTDSPKDDYRWDIFPWLKEQIKEHCVNRLIILGDLTDKKDKHSAALVNRLIKGFNSLVYPNTNGIVEEIVILKGNHDYIDEDCPFFEFLDAIPSIKFITEPISVGVHHKSIYRDIYLPHTRNPKEDWKEYLDVNFPVRYIFMHQTISGSMFANGFKFKSDSAQEYNDILNKHEALVYSGDVHVPQEIGTVTYVGSPYSIKYGDTWTGRAILLKGDKESILEYLESPIKWNFDISSIEDLNLKDVEEGDLAKIRIHLSREEYYLYNELKIKVKNILDKLGVESKIELKAIKSEVDKEVVIRSKDIDLSSTDIVKQFGKREQLDRASIKIGLELLGV